MYSLDSIFCSIYNHEAQQFPEWPPSCKRGVVGDAQGMLAGQASSIEWANRTNANKGPI